jgi:cytochrome P450
VSTALRAAGVAAPLLARLPSRRAKLAAFVLSPALRAEPWRLYAELQRREPVLRTRFAATLVSRHADVTAVLRARTTSVDEAKATAFAGADRSSPMSRLTQRMMLFRDPPDHERLRRLVARAFTPRRVAELRGAVEDIVERRLDLLAPAGAADLVDELAYPVPIEVVCRLLGLPDRDHERVRRLATPIAVAFDVDLFRDADTERAGDIAAAELEAYLRAVATTPALRVPGGLLEELLDAADDDRLSLDEAIAGAALLLLAGHETTSNLLSAGVLALLRAPAQAARWRAGDPLVEKTATDELLRFTSPVQFTQRVVVEPTTVGGEAVEPGELLALLLGAANRDPAVFAEPHRLDLARDPNPHVGFGTGIHACLGAALARLETDVAVPAVLRRWPDLRLDGRPRWRPTFVLRGLSSLPVRWS